MRKTKRKLFKYLLFLIFVTFLSYRFFFHSPKVKRTLNFFLIEKKINFSDDGILFNSSTNSNTIEDFLKEKNIQIQDGDLLIPEAKTKITNEINFVIHRKKKATIKVDGEEISDYTLKKNVRNFLEEKEIILSKLDKTEPGLNFPIQNEIEITITRINIEEKIEQKDIDFKKTIKNDDELGWREKKIQQKGEKGVQEIKYEITYKNGKEVSKKIIEKRVVKEPVEQIEIQGTYVKLGKSHKGQGTWYSFKGGLFAANPWLPMGSYVKVTNKENGKSVIVQINDRGPFGGGRIIDLDKVAFQKIASLGAGVIDVKVEEILN